MKKYFALATIAAATLIISASCSKKEDPQPDLAAIVAGDYIGTLKIGDDVFIDVHVMVTRLSITGIQIAPDSDPVSFYADVSELFGEFKLNVPSQVVSGPGTSGSITVVGNSLMDPEDPTKHGLYSASTNKMIYSVNFIDNGNNVPVDFQGIKQ